MIFFVYRSNYTCLPVFWYFSKFSRHLTHPCQQINSISAQCLQQFNRILSSPSFLSIFSPLVAAATSANVKTFSFSKSTYKLLRSMPPAFQVAWLFFFNFFYYRSICIMDNDSSRRRTRNACFRARRAYHSTTSGYLLFPRKRRMVLQNTLFADK